MNRYNLTGSYALIEAAFWMSYGSIITFASVYLLDCHVSNTTIGIIIAVGGGISALVQPLLGTLSDRYKSFSEKNIMQILTALSFISGILLLMIGEKNRAAACIVYALTILMLQTITPFMNSYGINCSQAGCQLDFGKARAAGSLGYAVCAAVLGRMASQIGARVIPAAMVLCSIVLEIILMTLPGIPRKTDRGNTNNKRNSPFFFRYRKYLILLVGMFLVYYGHVLLNCFTLQIIQTKGGGSTEMGIAIGIAASVELVVMLSFSKISNHINTGYFLRIAGIVFTIKIFGSLIVRSMTAFYVLQLLQMGAWGLIAIAIVYYVNQVIAPEDSVKGQAYANMTYTMSCVIGAWLGGSLIDLAGVKVMLISGIAASAVGTVIIFIGTEVKNKRTDQNDK